MLDLFPGSPKKQTITEVMPNRSWIFQRGIWDSSCSPHWDRTLPLTNPVPSPNFAIHELVPRSPAATSMSLCRPRAPGPVDRAPPLLIPSRDNQLQAGSFPWIAHRASRPSDRLRSQRRRAVHGPP